MSDLVATEPESEQWVGFQGQLYEKGVMFSASFSVFLTDHLIT